MRLKKQLAIALEDVEYWRTQHEDAMDALDEKDESIRYWHNIADERSREILRLRAKLEKAGIDV